MIGEQVKQQLTALQGQSSLATIPNQFEDIQLDELEQQEALRKGREAKYYKIKQDEYWARVNSVIDWSKPNARELYETLKDTKSQAGERFQVTDWNLPILRALCLYFSGDIQLESQFPGMKLSKGIMLMGTPGTGKTHLMNFFAKNPYQSYVNVTTKLIAERYRTQWTRDEKDALEYYSQPAKAEYGHVYGHTELGYCFGDLGTEGVKKSYGNEVNVMEHIIFQRYENKLPFPMTHVTTNLNAQELEESYGLRIRDRIREMFNVFTLNGKSFR